MGTVKLADFGLSKTLPVNKHAAFDLDDKFKLTGETGSYRFMAREVFVHEAYNNKVQHSKHSSYSCWSPTWRASFLFDRLPEQEEACIKNRTEQIMREAGSLLVEVKASSSGKALLLGVT